MLSCKDVTVNFGGLVAVNNVSFFVERNEILGMIGPNGAGKTTLFNAICGNVKYTKGKIIFENHDLAGLGIDERCKLGIGRSFQIPRLFEKLTVRENVLVGALCRAPKLRNAEEIAQNAMENVDINKIGNLLPSMLTIGQRKRLELARAFATQPKLLLLDEIMGGLHVSEVNEICDLLKKIRDQGITIFMIEHVIGAVVTLCDRVIVMNQGILIAEGTPAEIMSNKEVIEAYLGREEENA